MAYEFEVVKQELPYEVAAVNQEVISEFGAVKREAYEFKVEKQEPPYEEETVNQEVVSGFEAVKHEVHNEFKAAKQHSLNQSGIPNDEPLNNLETWHPNKVIIL